MRRAIKPKFAFFGALTSVGALFIFIEKIYVLRRKEMDNRNGCVGTGCGIIAFAIIGIFLIAFL